MGLERAGDWLFPAFGMLRNMLGHSIIQTYSAQDVDYLRRKGIKCFDVVCDYRSERIRFAVPNDQIEEAIHLLNGEE
jgi:hypothetical protein